MTFITEPMTKEYHAEPLKTYTAGDIANNMVGHHRDPAATQYVTLADAMARQQHLADALQRLIYAIRECSAPAGGVARTLDSMEVAEAALKGTPRRVYTDAQVAEAWTEMRHMDIPQAALDDMRAAMLAAIGSAA